MLFKFFQVFVFDILYLLLKILEKASGRFIMLRFKDFLEKKSYISKTILKKNISFFIPNELIRWRVDTILDKEPETIQWINSFNNKCIFWDIGANIGLYSIYAAKCKKNIKVYTFEPSTSNLRTLSRNISINKLQNKIFIIPFALSNFKNKILQLKEKQFTEGGALNAFGVNYDFSGKNFSVENSYNTFGTSLDDLLKKGILKHPDYIKIDVDGIEDLILIGAKKMLSNNKVKSILIEINDKFKIQKKNILKIMKENNFKIISKTRNDFYYKNEFNGIYNYIFQKI
jgi:FkbM family methyltransferase